MPKVTGFAHHAAGIHPPMDPAAMGSLEPVRRESVEAFRDRMEAKGARARSLRVEEEQAAQSQVTARRHVRPVAQVVVAPDPSPALPPAAPSAPAPLSTPPPTMPDIEPMPTPDELPAVADFNATLVCLVEDLLASTDRLEAAADLLVDTRVRLARARRAGTELLALLPIPGGR